MTLEIKDEDITDKECRFAVYIRNPEYDMPDLHFVKECVHLKDGTSHPRTQLFYDMPRPYFVAKKGFRNHQQAKEWEYVDRLIENSCPERMLTSRLANALGKPYFKGSRRNLLEEAPYAYGIDITSTSIIKHRYRQKYSKRTPYSVAVFDIETNMHSDAGEPIMASITSKTRVCTVALRSFFKGHASIESRIHQIVQKYLGTVFEERKIQFELILVDDEMQMWREIFNKAHLWQPDFLSAWNMDFEWTKFIESCNRFNVNPADITSDPSVPVAYRYFEYKQGKNQKVTSSGLVTPVSPAARWHVLTTPASWYPIDSMCTYKQTRVNTQEKASYSLDAILNEELKIGKMKFEDIKGIPEGTADWHIYMQENHPFEYLAYNIWDCIAVEILDEKIKDLSTVMPTMAQTSDFARFNSNPRRTVDQLHWFVQEHGLVMGATSDGVKDEFDTETLSRQDWIEDYVFGSLEAS